MFDDDAYELDKGQPRWEVRAANGLQDQSLYVDHYFIFDVESDVPLNAEYVKQEDAAEVCGILNQYEVEIAQLQAKFDGGHNGAGINGK